jgi:tetratricopeptide (TPR) repeat protein/uncharacterized protein YkwD
MNAFEKLSQKLALIKTEGDELFEFYTALWENSALLNPEQFLEIFEKTGKLTKTLKAKSAHQLSEGLFYIFFPTKGNIFEKLSDTLNSFQTLGDMNAVGATQSLLALYYKNMGRLDKAQEFIQHAIKNIKEDKRYIYFLGISYYQAGEIHHLLKDYATAINFFKTGHSYSIGGAGINARLLNAIGTVYRDTNELEKAYEYFVQALKEIEGKNNHILESKIYADIGNYYFRKGDYAQCLAFQQKSIKLREENKLINPLITNYIELAELFLKQNKNEDALHYALLAEKLATELNIVIKLFQTYLIVSTIYEALDNKNLALAYYKKYHLAKEEVFSQESARKMKQLSMHHEMETVQKEKEIFRLRNVVLKEALEEIEASIRYASRIQTALLPHEKYIDRNLNRLKKLFAFFIIVFNLALNAQTWTEAQLLKANTAKDITYLTQPERETILYINLARMYPKDFAKYELTNHPDSKYKSSLIAQLKNAKATLPLNFDKELYENAKCFAAEQGKRGDTGHIRKQCKKNNYAECCSYGMESGKDIVLQLLVDKDVPSLGHRKNCLNNEYTKIGVSVHEHKKWDTCAILEIIW